MKVYCYFLPEKSYKFLEYDYIEELVPIIFEHRVVYLYAYTCDKKLAKEFEKERNMHLFQKHILNMEEGSMESENFFCRHSIAELDYYLIPDDERNIYVLMTDFENSITIYGLPFYAGEILSEDNVTRARTKCTELLEKKYRDIFDYLEFYRIDELMELEDPEFFDMRGQGWNLLNLFVAIFKELF